MAPHTPALSTPVMASPKQAREEHTNQEDGMSEAYSPYTEDWSEVDYETRCHWCGQPCPEGTTGAGGCSAACGVALKDEQEWFSTREKQRRAG